MLTEKEPVLEEVPFTEEELVDRGELITKLEAASEIRESHFTEFDDQNYSYYYEKNAEAANSYLRPKKNKEDTRIVTGTTKEKVNTMLSACLNYNFEAEIQAYDENNLVVEGLGKEMQDMVTKSREIEGYEDKRKLIYKELFDQGTCFVEECFVTKTEIEKKIENFNWGETIDPKKIKWDERLTETYGRCEVKLLNGVKVYLGNIKNFYIQEQPYIFTLEEITYSEAQRIYSNWERFKYVPRKVKKIVTVDDSTDKYNDWTLLETHGDFVEVIHYMDKWKNTYQILLNGVPMLPVGFPLTAISPSGEYPLAKGDVEPFSAFFAYSKSFPAKTKVDQQVLDEMLRLMILKVEQSYEPPMVNNTNRVLSRKIFLGGQITNNINSEKLKPLIDAKGVTNSEFAMFELMKRLVDEKTSNPVYSGESMSGNQTATQIRAMQRQQLMKMGIAVLGVISLERQLVWLRIQNILSNWTNAIDERIDKVNGEIIKIFQSYSLKTTNDLGQEAVKIMEFSPENSQLEPEQVAAEARLLEKNKYKKPVDLVYLNPEMLRKIRYTWFVNIVPTEKTTDDLKMVLFTNNVKNAAAIFGIQSLNLEYLKKRFAFMANENPDLFFLLSQQPTGMESMGGMSPNGQSNIEVEALNNMKSVESGMNPAYSEPQLINQLGNQ